MDIEVTLLLFLGPVSPELLFMFGGEAGGVPDPGEGAWCVIGILMLPILRAFCSLYNVKLCLFFSGGTVVDLVHLHQSPQALSVPLGSP